jgi:hypothetical protein
MGWGGGSIIAPAAQAQAGMSTVIAATANRKPRMGERPLPNPSYADDVTVADLRLLREVTVTGAHPPSCGGWPTNPGR